MARMRLVPRALSAGPIAVLAISLAACGSSVGLLSGQQASSLRASLDQVETALDQHDCSVAESHAIALESDIARLPSSVNGTVRSSLEQGVSTVKRLVAQDCNQAATTTQAQPPPTTTTTTTTTTTPPPPKTTTTSTTPATTSTQPGSTTTTTPGQGHGNGHGNGNGNGKGHGNGGGNGGGDPTTTTTTPGP